MSGLKTGRTWTWDISQSSCHSYFLSFFFFFSDRTPWSCMHYRKSTYIKIIQIYRTYCCFLNHEKEKAKQYFILLMKSMIIEISTLIFLNSRHLKKSHRYMNLKGTLDLKIYRYLFLHIESNITKVSHYKSIYFLNYVHPRCMNVCLGK